MYGLESGVFNETHARKLDSTQPTKNTTTTYINRDITNEFVYAEANKALSTTGRKNIQRMTQFHMQRRKILLAKLITQAGEEPGARATLQDEILAPHDYGKRRVGRPRTNWVKQTLADFWHEARRLDPETSELADFEPENQKHDQLMRRLAREYNSKHQFVSPTPTYFGPYGHEQPVTPGRFGPYGEEMPTTPTRN